MEEDDNLLVEGFVSWKLGVSGFTCYLDWCRVLPKVGYVWIFKSVVFFISCYYYGSM